jgi:predicted ArsR family transcriptional regulator
MRARKNESTAAILQELTRGDGTCQAIAGRLGTKGPKVSMILLHLVRMGQASRKTVHEGEIVVDQDEGISRPRYVYVYSITQKGASRLETIVGTLSEGKPAGKKRRGR